MVHGVIKGVAYVFLIAIASTPLPGWASDLWQVIRVTDGDTFVARKGALIERVRLIGIDAPENARNGSVAQCYSREATRHLSRLALGRDLVLSRDPLSKNRDSYGRLLRYASHPSSTRMINEELLASGNARVYTRFRFAQSAQFIKDANAAKQKRLGLHNPSVCKKTR